MRDVWRKTLESLKAYPALLLPLVGATLTDFYLEWLNKNLARWIMRWVETTHSALGFETQSPDPSRVLQAKALLWALPISLCLRVIMFSAYVAGFVLAARLVRDLVQDERPDWKVAFAFLRMRIVRVILFAAAIFVLSAFAIYLAAEVINLKTFAFLRTTVRFDIEVSVSAFVACSCIAWIMAPFGLRLIADLPLQPIPRENKTLGRFVTIAAIAICLTLDELSKNFAPTINGAFQTVTWFRNFLIWPSISIMVDLPVLLLWVFLAVLAYQDLEVPEVPSPS